MFKAQGKSDKILKGITVLVFITFLGTGLFIFDDYGVTVDETFERQSSLVNLKFFLQELLHRPLPNELLSTPDLQNYEDKDYGVILQFPTVLFEYFTNFRYDISSILKLRHLWTFLNFYISVIFFNLLLYRRFRNRLVSLLGTLFLIISPRIFADAFYNIKDLMFLSWFIIGLFFLYRFIHYPTKWNSIILAIVIALASNTRIIGFILLIAACIYLIYAFLTKEINKKEFFINGMIFVGINIFLFFLFLPASWGNPIAFLLKTLQHFSKYDYISQELYLGKFIPSSNLPWHYLPVWIFISTPIIYIVLFLAGIVCLIKKNRNKDLDQIFDYLVLGILLVSLLLPICLHSTLYDGWRHFYFLYGPFLYLAVLGLSALLSIKNKIIKSLILGISVGSIIFNGAWMIRNHPYQMVYFNVLVRGKAPDNFERDYWGASSSECLRFIVSQSDDLRINVGDYDAGLTAAKFALKKSDRDRIVDDSFGYEANRMKYLVLNYTRVIGNEKSILFYEPVYKIQADGMNIATVLERKDRDGIWANAIVKDVKSNVNPQLTSQIFDQDDLTGWTTGRLQQKDDYLLFELKETTKLYGISILTSTERYETPQELRIEGSKDGTDWETLPLTYQTHSDYAFSPINVKYIKLILEESSDELAWTVNDVMFHLASNE